MSGVADPVRSLVPSVPALASISVPASEHSVASIAKTACASRSLRDRAAERHRVAAVEVVDDLAEEPIDVLEVAVLDGPEQLEPLVMDDAVCVGVGQARRVDGRRVDRVAVRRQRRRDRNASRPSSRSPRA